MNAQYKSSAQRTILKPVNYLFQLFKSKTKVEIWLFEDDETIFQGLIYGFDEYMNMVLYDAEEINKKKGTRINHGKIMLKGDNITLIRAAVQ